MWEVKPQPELKDCPFCGGKAKARHMEGGYESTVYFILCDGCGATQKGFKVGEWGYSGTENETRTSSGAILAAAKKWNRRA